MSRIFFLLTGYKICDIRYLYPIKKPYYIIIMKKNNPIAKQLSNPKYRSRVVPKKRVRDETYDWVADWQEEQEEYVKTTKDTRKDKTVQSYDDS